MVGFCCHEHYFKHGSLASVQERLAKYLLQEHTLLDHFGGNDDILVSEADRFLSKNTPVTEAPVQ